MRWKALVTVGALLAAAIVTACTVVVDDPPNRPRHDRPYCTREYDPVCARRDGRRETFNNECEAEKAGFRVVRRGECRGDRDDDNDRSCSRQYDPVCARRDGRYQTFANDCLAESAGWRVVSGGECSKDANVPPPSKPKPPQGCSKEYRPVCGRRGSELKTFGNACVAESTGFQVIADGEC